MPDRPLTIATYAAGASLMAITLVYVFGPTFFLDNDAAHSSKASRKKGVVGLVNPANDCFINSILQALAGLPELRAYLIREVYRRELGGPEVYNTVSTPSDGEQRQHKGKPIPQWLRISLQQGAVTAGLKEMLDALNERPIYKKAISAQTFIHIVEHAFNTRISRSQQDAQEFLQVIVERLADEHSAGRAVRQEVRSRRSEAESRSPEADEMKDQAKDASVVGGNVAHYLNGDPSHSRRIPGSDADNIHQAQEMTEINDGEGEEPFPMEGKLESQVECLVCHFKPKPSVSSFLTLTLNVPHNEGATTLSTCLDGIFKIEHIEDFKCDRCRLEHALQMNGQQLSKLTVSDEERAKLDSDRSKLEVALREDPESPPKTVRLPPLASAPKRPITRHTQISIFPRLLVLHLSRSIWDPHAVSSKNVAKVLFPEILPLGSLLERKVYRLLGVVTHKGGHHSGHYESFRRQVLAPPFSTRASMGTEGIYSLRESPAASSAASSPRLRSTNEAEDVHSQMSTSPKKTTTTIDPDETQRLSELNIEPSHHFLRPKAAPTPPLDAIPAPGLPDPPGGAGITPPASVTPAVQTRTSSVRGLQRRRKAQAQQQDRWWRISDEKVKECKTAEVLAMQREVYLLFYEIVSD